MIQPLIKTDSPLSWWAQICQQVSRERGALFKANVGKKKKQAELSCFGFSLVAIL